MMPVKALESSRYGRLTVLQRQQGGWLCSCDCGNLKIVTGSHLREGRVQSCGCLNTEVRRSAKTHGKRHTRTWAIWSNMIQRCGNSSNPSFRNYGARGISVCDRWTDFQNFLLDMGEAPVGLTLERIKNEEGYSTGNCRWATRSEQAINKRTNRLIEVGGLTKPLKVWCSELAIPYWTAHARLRRGKTASEALGFANV